MPTYAHQLGSCAPDGFRLAGHRRNSIGYPACITRKPSSVNTPPRPVLHNPFDRLYTVQITSSTQLSYFYTSFLPTHSSSELLSTALNYSLIDRGWEDESLSGASSSLPASLARSWESLRVDLSWVTILLLWSVDSSILQAQPPAQLLILKVQSSRLPTIFSLLYLKQKFSCFCIYF